MVDVSKIMVDLPPHQFILAHIDSPSELKSYIVHKTLNPRLENAGGTGLHPTTQKGFLALIDGNQDFW